MNDRVFAKFILNFLFVVSFFLTSSAAVAADSEHHQRVDAMDIYLGVIPAEITQDISGEHGGKNHETRYHVLVAIFDVQTGKRITDAKVLASVSEPDGEVLERKNLEPMLIMDAPSYGNYFRMTTLGKHSLRFKILDPARKYAVKVEFFFVRATD